VVSKIPKIPIKSRKPKKIIEKPNYEKKPIRILKKPTGSIQFRFYKLEIEKTEPNRTPTEKNPSQTKKPSQIGFCSKKLN